MVWPPRRKLVTLGLPEKWMKTQKFTASNRICRLTGVETSTSIAEGEQQIPPLAVGGAVALWAFDGESCGLVGGDTVCARATISRRLARLASVRRSAMESRRADEGPSSEKGSSEKGKAQFSCSSSQVYVLSALLPPHNPLPGPSHSSSRRIVVGGFLAQGTLRCRRSFHP